MAFLFLYNQWNLCCFYCLVSWIWLSDSDLSIFSFCCRKYFRNECEFFHFLTLQKFKPSVFGAADLKITHRLRAFPLNCIGIGALVDSDGGTASNLVPVANQVLLMGSILLTYMAGVIPVDKSYTRDQKNNSVKNALRDSSDISGR